MNVCPLNLPRRVVPSAAMVATTVAMNEADVAMINDRTVASCTTRFSQAAAYHCSDKPPHTATDFSALKE